MRRYSFILVISVALSYFCIENILAPAMDIAPGSIKEMLSLPFQQTARYVKEFPDDVTKDERKAIDAVIAYARLKEYNPELSDPVKNTARRDIRKNLTRYFKHAWYPMMLKHPGVYIEALLHKSFGYYYPFSARSVMGAFQSYIKGKPVATGDFDFHYIFSKKVRDIFSHYSESWRIIPGLATVINPGTYTWILLMAAGFMCYCARYRKLLSLTAPILNVAVCIASPVNGLMRYAIPLMACTPVIIYWSIEHLIHAKIPSGEKTHLTEAAVEQASDCAL